MRKKILHKSSCPQSSETIGLGEFPDAETIDSDRKSGIHTPTAHQNSQVCGCDARNEQTAEETRNASELGFASKFAIALPLLLIKIYQLTLSPYIGQCCRFTPSCSRYSAEAFRTHGFWRGMFLTIRRIARCQPLCPGGYDPVPPRKNKKTDG